MSPGAKVFLALAGVGAVIGVIVIASPKSAHAAPGLPKQPKPGSNAPPDVVVPPGGGGFVPPLTQPPPPPQGAPPSFFPPVTSFPPIPNPLGGLNPAAPPSAAPPPFAAPPFAPPSSAPPGTTITLPNPLGGAPLGTFNPVTGNVFGPDGTIIGTFNPTTGLFTASNGMKVQIPGFGSGSPVVPAPSLPVGPVPSAPPSAAPPAALPQATAPVTTVQADTAAMVSSLLAAEAFPGWNKTDPTVGAWQRARPPLVVDSKFGPKSALTVANSVGTVPLVRYWSLNGIPKATQLANYQASLMQLANAATDPVRAAQLRFSAQREQAQAFSTHGPLPAVPTASQVQVQQVA